MTSAQPPGPDPPADRPPLTRWQESILQVIGEFMQSQVQPSRPIPMDPLSAGSPGQAPGPSPLSARRPAEPVG
jgi:hypothetical protein